MSAIQAAIYARVSSDVQQEARTIESRWQICAPASCGVDFSSLENWSLWMMATAALRRSRPALERLRDVVAAGGIDQLYVHCPDRLARNYDDQVLLLEEFLQAGVEVIFLNREVGQTPEDELLLQVQGMIAEYERAKILERSRRGKRHAAQVGRVSVLSCVPTATARSPNRMGWGKPASRWTWLKRGSYAKSSPGWGGTAAPSGKYSGG